jgi:hypothetical protein
VPRPPGQRGKGPSATQADRAREEQARQDRHQSEELADACARLEEDLEVLKGRYDLYFLGVERREPARDRDEMRRRVARLKGEYTRNTGIRFRIDTLNARFLAYQRMWQRSAREKEEGTYLRDVLKLRRKLQRDGDATPASARSSAVPAATERLATPARGATPIPAGPAPSAAHGEGGLPGGVSQAQLRAVYAEYVEAKRRCQEDVSRLSYDALVTTLAQQLPELLARHHARTVELRVVVKDGRAVLKATPRT